VSHPQDLPLREQAQLIADGGLDPGELLDATLSRFQERNGPLNAVVATFPDESRAMLASAPRGALHGVPVTIKDMFSLPWRGYHNGTRHELGARCASGPFRRLRDAGAVVVGVDNQHELGMGTTGRVSAYGAAGNPWNPAHCAGGSSSGSAAAVAARMVGGAVGSDSGGSTRLPAGWCGVVGLKVTYGSLPYDGYTGANSTLSAPGAFGRDAADARLLLEALLARALPAGSAGALRVGVFRRPYWEDIDPQVEEACRAALLAGGLSQTELELPFVELFGPAGAVRASAELGVAVPDVVVPELDALTRGVLQYGALQPARRLVRADRVRARLRRAFVDAFAGCDLIAWPTNPAPAPPIDAPVLQLPSGPALADAANVIQAIPANLAGIPGVSLPVGFHASGLPIGLQLLAPWGEESRLLDAVERIERATDRCWVNATPCERSI
jgi:Asp-tRNA(Asn)/Glu-tRNA(Gln) amidotransferase A subunit family amidase